MDQSLNCLDIVIRGQVQGVGLRPRIKRLADRHGIAGWTRNRFDHVQLRLPARHPRCDDFVRELRQFAADLTLAYCPLDAPLPDPFTILPSPDEAASGLLQLPADRGICDACVAEFNDPANRRYRFPLIACHDCGPRLAVLKRMPFARNNTSLQPWPLCERCQAEFHDTASRRFHSELICCADCGPRVFTLGGQQGIDPLLQAVECLQQGGVLGLKSQGGFQLLCRADQAAAVTRIRENKRRPYKPLALLVQSVEQAEKIAVVSSQEAALLSSSARPIVLVSKRADPALTIASNVSAHTPDWGLMLPVSGFHLALAEMAGMPLVCTSANLSGEPLLFEDAGMAQRWPSLCDLCLTHDLPILLPQDDSVVMNTSGNTQILRRSRGYVHDLFSVAAASPMVAWGGDLKHAFALADQGKAMLGPYIGDMESFALQQRQHQVFQHLCELQQVEPVAALCDFYPGYHTVIQARQPGALPAQQLQHHVAHVAATDALCNLPQRYLALAWDGTGWGEQGAGWGSEAFLVERGHLQRVAALAPFRLPGGAHAVRQPWRMVLALSFATGIPLEQVLPHLTCLGVQRAAIDAVWQMLHKGINCPPCHAVGRLFDGVSAWLCGCVGQHFEGDAAIRLQALASGGVSGTYSFSIENRVIGDQLEGQWQAAWIQLLDRSSEAAPLAFAFHQGLVRWALDLARHFAVQDLALSGGCFQNRLLQSLLLQQADSEGIRVHWPDTVPLNDGGLAIGQLRALERGWLEPGLL